jgi:predicted phage terminase large subunit-like protein
MNKPLTQEQKDARKARSRARRAKAKLLDAELKAKKAKEKEEARQKEQEEPSTPAPELTGIAAALAAIAGARFTEADRKMVNDELLRRRARKGICEYATVIDVPGRPVSDDPDNEIFIPVDSALATHHKLVLNAWEETANTKHGRLMIFMPPGSAKSTYASIVAPSRYLGMHPHRRLILASYGDDLARKMGRRTRSILRQERYKSLFECELTSDSQAAQEFALTNGSEYMAAGLLTGVTGNRAHGVVIDDPIKGREQAESEVVREKTWDAYRDDLLTRLMPGGFVILIQTRWHQNDMAGRILPEEWKGESGLIPCRDGNTWRVICLQAMCTRDDDPLGRKYGEYLWPEWFDRRHWEQYESSPRTWASLYQQLPTPGEGDLFKVDKIEVIDAEPVGNIEWIRGWDLASTTDRSGSATAGVKLGRMRDGTLIIGNVVRQHFGPDQRDLLIVNTAKFDGPPVKQDIPKDPGQAGNSLVLYLTRRLQEARATVYNSPETGDKVTRAEPFASQVNVGNVKMIRGAWNHKYREELRMFPNGTHDDQVDATSRAYARLITRGVMRISDEAMQQAMYGSMDGQFIDTYGEAA